MATTEERIETLYQGLLVIREALERHFTTHNTGGGTLEREGPSFIARLEDILDEASEQMEC